MDVFIIVVFAFVILVVVLYWFLNFMEWITSGTQITPDDRQPPLIELLHIHMMPNPDQTHLVNLDLGPEPDHCRGHDHDHDHGQNPHPDRMVISSPNNNASQRNSKLRQSVRKIVQTELSNEECAHIDAGAAMVSF